jgi:hypothetical protein
MRKIMLVTLACTLIAIVGLKFADVLWAQAKEEAAVLFSFEKPEDLKAWQVEDELKDKVQLSVVAEHATDGKAALKMVLKPHEWPGMFTTSLPKDWSGYTQLKFDVFADEGADLCVRIDDTESKDYGSRYNSEGNFCNKGANTVTLWLSDVGGKIDLKKVKALYIFSTNVQKDLTFTIDNIRLVKAAAK